MFRFYVNNKENDTFVLSKEIIKHIRVARATNEEFICVYNEKFYICKLKKDKALIIKKLDYDHEFNGKIVIAASIINIKRFEWLIQKASELGATSLIPIISDNISIKLPENINQRIKRWNDISINAAEQSFRNKAMIVEKPMKFLDAIKIKMQNKYIAHEKFNNKTPCSFPTNVIFFIGPEGGFSDFEIKNAKENSVEVISLGKRILRAETASIFVLSRVN